MSRLLGRGRKTRLSPFVFPRLAYFFDFRALIVGKAVWTPYVHESLAKISLFELRIMMLLRRLEARRVWGFVGYNGVRHSYKYYMADSSLGKANS